MPEEREFLEELVISLLALELHEEGAMLPFVRFITADKDGGASLARFVRVVIDGKQMRFLLYVTLSKLSKLSDFNSLFSFL